MSNAFLFSIKWSPSVEATHMAEKHYIVVAELKDDAVAIVRRQAPKPCTTELLASGPSILDQARRAGLADGKAMEVSAPE